MPSDYANRLPVSGAASPPVAEDGASSAWLLIRQVVTILDEGHGARIAGMIALMLLGAAFEAVGIGLVVPFIAMLANPGIIDANPHLKALYEASGVASTTQFLMLATLALLAVFTLKNVYLGALTYLIHSFTTTRQVRLGQRLLSFYLHRPYAFHLQRNTAQLINIFTTEIGRVYVGVALPMFTGATEGAVLFFIGALLLAVEPQITVIALGVTAIAAGGIYLGFRDALKQLGEERVRQGGLMIKWINQGLGSIKETKIAGREAFFVHSFRASSARHARASRFFAVINALPRLVIELAAVGGLLLVVTVILLRGEALAAAIPALALFAMAALRIMPSLTRLFSALSSIRFYAPAVGPIYRDLLESRQQIAEAHSNATPPAHAFNRELELRDVSFSYDGVAAPAISGVSLSLPRGVSAGFVGPSGAGKTTLVDIMLGLLLPKGGHVLVDGADIQGNLSAWQHAIGYVPQAIYLLDDTLRRNVALGIPEADIDEERVREAIRLAQLETFVRAAPEGVNTMIGEMGVRLSGGERQRVGIARALYHRPPVLVFDEATSALDSTTEADIIATIGRLSGSRTIIQIAHRFSTVKACDVIYFLQRGRIVDRGRFDELMLRNAEFRRLAGEPDETQGELRGRAS